LRKTRISYEQRFIGSRVGFLNWESSDRGNTYCQQHLVSAVPGWVLAKVLKRAQREQAGRARVFLVKRVPSPTSGEGTWLFPLWGRCEWQKCVFEKANAFLFILFFLWRDADISRVKF